MSNSFEVLNDHCSNKRLTRSQLNHHQKLKALYHEEDDSQYSDNPALESSSSEQPSTTKRSIRGSLRIQFVKENVQKNRRPQRRVNKKTSSSSSMSPAPLKEEGDDSSSSKTRGKNEMTKSAVTVTPKPEDSPALNDDDDDEEHDEAPPPPPLTKEELAEKARIRASHPMTNIMEPGPNDCLFGRGGGTNHHPGNKKYRKLVESKKEKYLNSKRLDKPLVAMEIINGWRGLDPPGRFLKQDDVTKYWNDVGDKKAREKTSQALREKTPVKEREEQQGGGGGHGYGHNRPHYDYRERTARFEPGTSSPVGRHVRKSNLARDHSLGTETMGANEISLEGFSWDDKDRPVVRNKVVSPSEGGGRGHPHQQQGYPPYPPHHYPQHGEQPHHPYGEHYPPYYHEQHFRQPREGEHPEHGPPPLPPPGQYPYVREHSLSNNPLSDATTSHAAPPAFGEQPPPPPYYGYHSGYPPPPPGHPGYGPPPPPPPPGPYSPTQSRHEYYSQHPQHTQQHPQHPQQRSREHSLQMNPLKGASTSQPARDTFNEEGSHASYESHSRSLPPLPSPTYDRGGPPAPSSMPPPSPYYGSYGAPSPTQQGGWPAPPHAQQHPSPQFSYHPGSNPSAFGQYNSGDRSNSIRSLGSSVDAYYDRRDSATRSDSGSASATGGGTPSSNTNVATPNTPSAAAAPSPAPAASPPSENPASAGTSQDYSKIAELIRDSSDKSSTVERSSSMDEGGKSNEEYEDGILRSKSMPTGESGDVGGSVPVIPGGSSASGQTRKPSLLRKLSGGNMSRNSPSAATPPNGIMRPSAVHANNVHRPDMVKRDTSNQPETFETKRSIKRVVLSRDQSAVSRRLKEEQGFLANSNPHHPPNVKVGFDSATNAGGIGRPKLGSRVSSKLTKSEMLDRKLSVEMNKLGLDGLDDNGVPALDRMTTGDFMSMIDDSSSELPSPSPTITELINNPSDSSVADGAEASYPPPMMGERVTTIDAIAMDIANGKPESEWVDTLDLINEEGGVDEDLPSGGSGINADIAEKWLKGET